MNAFLRDSLTASLWFLRGLRNGDWIWLIMAVIIATTTVTTVELLAQTVKQSMLRQAANNLGADLVIRSSRPIDEKWREQAQTLNLQVSESQTVVTMASYQGDFQLVQLKAVSKNYPLRGQVNITPKNNEPLYGQQIFIQTPLKQQLGVELGEYIDLGVVSFKVMGTIEPSGMMTGLNAFAYQIWMPITLLPTTHLIGPGSRVQYELAFAGDDAAIQALSDALQQSNSADIQILSAQAPSRDLAQSLDTAWLFLELSALSAVLVAGLSIVIASRFYLRRWQGSMALMRALGANNRQMTRLFSMQLTWMAVLSSLIGVGLGYLIFIAIQPLLKTFFDPLILPEPGWFLLQAFAIGLLVLWSFAWQAFQNALKIAPIHILKNTVASAELKHWAISFVLVVLLALTLVASDKVIWVVSGLLVTALVLYAGAVVLLKLVGRLQLTTKGWLKLSLAALAREPGLVKIQLISLGLVLFVLMLMTFVRQDLLTQWQASLPEDTPNTFMVNVQPDQQGMVRSILDENHLNTPLEAMVRGRLVKVNERELLAKQQQNNRARRLLERESNVGVMEALPSYNQVVETLVDPDSSLPWVSVEQDVAKLLGINLGDVLTFNFTGREVSYQVTSFRKVNWQSFRLNFFFIIEPSEPWLPLSYISSFKVPSAPAFTQLSAELTRQTPGVLLIDVGRILEQVQKIMSQASWAVSGLYLFTLMASLVVLFTATLASQQSRIQSWLLLRTLGASQRTITQVGLMEFILLGGLAGLLAATFAQIGSVLISHFLLKVTPTASWSLWALSIVLGAGLLLLFGWLTQKRYLLKSPKALSRFLADH